MSEFNLFLNGSPIDISGVTISLLNGHTSPPSEQAINLKDGNTVKIVTTKNAVSYYDYENENNEYNKTIRVMEKDLREVAVENLKDLMKEDF